MLADVRRWLTPARLGVLGLVALIAVVVLYVTPSDDYIFLPSRAQPLAPDVIVAGAHPDNDGGGIYYVDVRIRKASILESWFPSLRDGATLVPAKDYVTPGTSEQQQFQADLQDMRRSQQVAEAVALRSAGYKVTARPTGVLVTTIFGGTPAEGKLRPGDVIVAVDGRSVPRPEVLGRAIRSLPPRSRVRITVRRGTHELTVSLRTAPNPQDPKQSIVGIGIDQAATIHIPIKVRIDLGRVGGPSAGLAFALEIMEELGRDVDHGLKVAATGELALDGSVRPIGGVEQ
jgi:PDZ domain-containing protein